MTEHLSPHELLENILAEAEGEVSSSGKKRRGSNRKNKGIFLKGRTTKAIKKQAKRNISNDLARATSEAISDQDKVEELMAKIIDESGLDLLQTRAIRLMGIFEYTPQQVADELMIPVSRVNKWLKDDVFVRSIRALETLHTFDAFERKKKMNNEILYRIQDTILQRIATQELDSIPLVKLFDVLEKVNKMVAADVPTQIQVQHDHLHTFAALQSRFMMVENRKALAAAREKEVEAEFEEINDPIERRKRELVKEGKIVVDNNSNKGDR